MSVFNVFITITYNNIKTNNRVNLFTKVPDWKNSHGMDRVKLLDTFGYWAIQKDGKKRFDLNCTLKANVPNSQGLFLEVDSDHDLLVNYHTQDYIVKRYVAQWSLLLLKQRLLEKHHEKFWVKAISQIIDGGIIIVDYIMHKKENGTVRDHGFPFKIYPRDIGLLFHEPKTYVLLDYGRI